ncbi:MAG: beta-lactamase family protein, partial [Spirochaetia bacterium]|nr:beta-lactamase family protein [Spirochaetia bacterium]
IRQAMNHTAGLQNVPSEVTLENCCDWNAVCSAIAASKAAWPAGSKAAYHAVTYGWILGELARRVDRRAFSQILREDVCKPLGVEGLYVGIPDAVESRVAILEEANVAPQAPVDGPRPVPDWMWPLPIWMNRPDVRRACVPGSNGIMTARAIAKHYAALLPGGVGGVELLPAKRVSLATDPKTAAYDKTAQNPTVWALGYALNDGTAALENKRISAFGHGGYGGSTGFADPGKSFAFAYAKNVYGKEGFVAPVLEEIRAALGI